VAEFLIKWFGAGLAGGMIVFLAIPIGPFSSPLLLVVLMALGIGAVRAVSTVAVIRIEQVGGTAPLDDFVVKSKRQSLLSHR
jgi:hypothetical protein